MYELLKAQVIFQMTSFDKNLQGSSRRVRWSKEDYGILSNYWYKSELSYRKNRRYKTSTQTVILHALQTLLYSTCSSYLALPNNETQLHNDGLGKYRGKNTKIK